MFVQISAATDYNDSMINVYANEEYITAINISNNSKFVSNIHNVPCYTNGLHSGYGEIINFTVPLKRGNNSIKLVNPTNVTIDIEYLEINKECSEVTEVAEEKEEKEETEGDGISQGGIVGIVIAVLVVIAGICVFVYFFVIKDKEHDDVIEEATVI